MYFSSTQYTLETALETVDEDCAGYSFDNNDEQKVEWMKLELNITLDRRRAQSQLSQIQQISKYIYIITQYLY